MNRAGTITGVVLLAAAFAASGTGCAKARERWRARFNPPEPEPARMIEPSVENLSAAEEGLEIIVWTTNDPDHRVGRALREYAESAPPVPPADAALWAGVGLRLISVPAADLEALLHACPPVSPLQRQRFGQVPIWTPLVRGPQVPDGLPGPEARPLPGGRPRLIARSWVEPRITDNQRHDVVRTELGVQIEHARRQTLMADPTIERSIADEGPILHALLTAHTVTGLEALVLVAEQPGADWSEIPEPAPPTPPPSDEQAEDPESPPPSPIEAAPARQRTLGERMLSSPPIPPQGERPAIPARKVIVVFLPRLRSAPGADPLPGATPGAQAAEGVR